MIALWLALAFAHPLSPSVLRLEQTPEGVVAVWRTPSSRPTGTEVLPVLPCETSGRPEASRVGLDALETRWVLDCSSLAGRTVVVDGLAAAGTDVLVEWTTSTGTRTELLHGSRDRVELSAGPAPWSTPLQALSLGLWHLWLGADHLLFVLGLVLAVPGRKLVGAVSAFTLGHALSLLLVGAGGLVLPAALIEVGIAASLVWLAAELLGEQTPRVARQPIWICLPFGLLHGLGFAGAWRESGLADGSALGALFGFNLGIELGQLVVVGAALAAIRLVGPPSEQLRRVLAAVGGAVAAMWVWERLAML